MEAVDTNATVTIIRILTFTETGVTYSVTGNYTGTSTSSGTYTRSGNTATITMQDGNVSTATISGNILTYQGLTLVKK